MRTFIQKALDRATWQRFNIRTSLTWAIENGRAYIASDRWEVAAGATDYVELVADPDTLVRIYDRIIAVDGGRWEVDLLRPESITPGTDELQVSCLNCTQPINAVTKFRRGATNPVNVQTLERTMIPSRRGPQSAGALQHVDVFRVINGNPGSVLVLALTNTDGQAHTLNLQVIWSEE